MRIAPNLLRALVVTATAAAGLTVSATAGTASATENNCGIATCSVYFSRSETRRLDDALERAGWGEAGGAGICIATGIPTAGVGTAICSLIVAELTAYAELVKQVVGDAVHGHPPNGACFKITYTRGPAPVPTWVSTNNGKYCAD
jgi:hypothetical protein